MGRRHILFVGMALSIASMTFPEARGQDSGADPAAGPAFAAEPDRLSLPLDPTGEVGTKGGAAVGPAEPLEKPAEVPAKRDEAFERIAGTTAPVGAPGGSSGQGSSFIDRLLVGKQEVSVSVQVQGPTDLNLMKPAPFKIIVRNTGTADAFQVVVRDELPSGLVHVSSEPKALEAVPSLLTWTLDTLRAGEQKVISLQLKPTARGAVDHAATVTFLTGSKSRTQIHEPLLKVEQVLSSQKVLKGQNVEFRIGIRNTGDGPARNVTVQAKLSPGLRHESGSQPNEDTVYEILIPEIAAGQIESLDPLVVDTTQGGQQWCEVKAFSPDVEPHPEDAELISKLEVVEPMLKLSLSGAPKRFTETIAPYKITVENPGTAPAKNVDVIATLPLDGGLLVKVPPDAEYNKQKRMLRWRFPEIKPGGKSPELSFEVKVNRVGRYDVTVDSQADGALRDNSVYRTEVEGMADIQVAVLEMRRYVDIGGETMFVIRLRNYGTKDASKLRVVAKVSANLGVTEIAGGPATNDKRVEKPDGDEILFSEIEHLGAGKEIKLGVKVKAKDDKPRRATCRVRVTHDDFTEPVEGIKDITITNSRDLSATP